MFVVPRKRKNYKERRSDPQEHFVRIFRFTPENVEWLSEYFLEEMGEIRGGTLDAHTKMKLFLRYMADPGFQIGVAEDIGVCQATVSNAVSYVGSKIVEKVGVWVKFPSNIDTINTAKHLWLQKYKFPSAIVALDCTHIRIKKQRAHQHGDEYICRKQFPSINVQATCNADELFTSVSAEWPGSVHDSRIWKRSSVCRTLRGSNHIVLIADQGYGIDKCLMTPYYNPVTQQERAFKDLLKRERVIIEICFGQLKQRFPILQGTVRVPLNFVSALIVACVILHNIAKYLKNELVFGEEDHPDESEENIFNVHNKVSSNAMRIAGQQKQQQSAEIIHNLG